MWLAAGALAFLAVGVVAAIYVLRRMREARLQRALREAVIEGPRLVRFDALEASSTRLRRSVRAAEALLARGRKLDVPKLREQQAASNAGADVSHIVAWISDPAVVVGAAGAEQVLSTLLDDGVREVVVAAGEGFASAIANVVSEHGVSLARDFVDAALASDSIREALVKGSEAVAHDLIWEHGADIAGDVAAHAGAALEGVDLADGASAKLPVLTLLRSAVREGALLAEGKTSAGRAAAHVAIDSGAAFGGALIGAKVGAVIGTAFAPGVGTALGALAGKVLGGMAGAYTANSARRIPLERAEEALTAQVNASREAIESKAAALARTGEEAAREARRDFRAKVSPPPDVRTYARDTIRGPTCRLVVAAHHAVDIWARDLAHRQAQLHRSVPHDLPIHRLLRLDVSTQATAILQESLSAENARLQAARAILPPVQVAEADPALALKQLVRASVPDSVGTANLVSQAHQRIEAVAKAVTRATGEWIAGTTRLYERTIRRAEARIGERATDLRDTVEGARRDIEHKQSEVLRHRTALGLT